MRFRHPLVRSLCLAVILLFPVIAYAVTPEEPFAKSVPEKVGEFQAVRPPGRPPASVFDYSSEDFGVTVQAFRDYASPSGHVIQVDVIQTLTDSGAYALLTKHSAGKEGIRLGVVGTAASVGATGICFFKGRSFVLVTSGGKVMATAEELLAFARAFADTLDPSEDDIPVLVKHLPNWQSAQPLAQYSVTATTLKQIIPEQAILNEVNFEGGAEAVVASYSPSRLVIVEFTTPQLAGDNDRRIAAKIQELRTAAQPIPSAYRRVGNYSVFVFDAPDEKTAAQLIDQVKYEQVVQWLGENPYWFEKVQRIYAQTTAGVLLTVIQSSGLSLLICLGIGGIFGVFLFRRRRAQQAGPAYSDAGGMVRLNIDEMTADGDRSKLLSDGKS